ncbi:hypothetical protein ACWIUD_03525 [Helicobacter sp. 23-1044]
MLDSANSQNLAVDSAKIFRFCVFFTLDSAPKLSLRDLRMQVVAIHRIQICPPPLR